MLVLWGAHKKDEVLGLRTGIWLHSTPLPKGWHVVSLASAQRDVYTVQGPRG